VFQFKVHRFSSCCSLRESLQFRLSEKQMFYNQNLSLAVIVWCLQTVLFLFYSVSDISINYAVKIIYKSKKAKGKIFPMLN
jgi:hypothetical protein